MSVPPIGSLCQSQKSGRLGLVPRIEFGLKMPYQKWNRGQHFISIALYSISWLGSGSQTRSVRLSTFGCLAWCGWSGRRPTPAWPRILCARPAWGWRRPTTSRRRSFACTPFQRTESHAVNWGLFSAQTIRVISRISKRKWRDQEIADLDMQGCCIGAFNFLCEILPRNLFWAG